MSKYQQLQMRNTYILIFNLVFDPLVCWPFPLSWVLLFLLLVCGVDSRPCVDEFYVVALLLSVALFLAEFFFIDCYGLALLPLVLLLFYLMFHGCYLVLAFLRTLISTWYIQCGQVCCGRLASYIQIFKVACIMQQLPITPSYDS